MLHPSATRVSLRRMDGEACREIGIAELKALAAEGHVVGLVGGRGRLRQIRPMVPPDQAFRDLGETRARVKDLFHSDANDTVRRSDSAIPKIHKAHHKQHCDAWNDTAARVSNGYASR
jgi:hypothetical protein